MKKLFFLFASMALCYTVFSQQTRYYLDADSKFKEAKEYFQKEQYSLAYPLLKELRHDIRETDQANNPIQVQEINYYAIACGLKQNESRSASDAIKYIEVEKNNARVQMMNYHLAEYYFRDGEFAKAIQYYEGAGLANLSNKEIADMSFHQGYAYFNLQNFSKAKPLFNSIRMMKDDPNYLDANYYYGFLAFRDKQYGDALESFKLVENEPNYNAVVPYYIAQIYYLQGKKDEAITYIQDKLQSGSSSQYYDLELNQLIGHAYFEKKEYEKALPYLENYVGRSKKVRREELYELSYCYYRDNNMAKAIEGFKQLSGKQDSLSQHAMYLLGDAYLKTDQKANARNAFLFCSTNSSNPGQKEIAKFQYAKLSFELGYQDEALNSLSSFLADYPNSEYNAEAKELLIHVLANTNNYKDAQALLESLDKPTANAQKLYPRILYGRASELISDGQLGQANELLNKIIADPNSSSVLPYTYFWKGEIAYRNNQLDSAIKYYQLYANSGTPENGEANATNVKYNLGYAYLRKENYPVALSYFEPLSRTASLSSNAFVQDAFIRTTDCYFMEKNYSKAKTGYDKVVQYSWPAEDYATFQLAMLAGVNSANQKISLLKTMIRKFPNSTLLTDANMEVAKAYMSNEKFSEAIPYLSDIIKTSGNKNMVPEAYLKLGTAYFNLNSNSEALNEFKELVDKYPNSQEAADALDIIRTIYLDESKPEEYAAYMRSVGKPLSVNTEDSLTYYAAEKLYDDQKMNEAVAAFSNYIQHFPNGQYVLDAQFNKAEIYNNKKDWANALPGYEYVAAHAPNDYAERAVLGAARIYFFEQKDYAKAEGYYIQLKDITGSQELKLEAMRGLLRCQYKLEKWTEAAANAKELTEAKGSSDIDKSLANMAIAKSLEASGSYDEAISNFKQVVKLNKAELAAEARYEIASCWFKLDKLKDAEKAAFETINKSGSYDFWVTKSYILLGDIFFAQKDYFNAKATFQSVVDNTIDAGLKAEAQTKLDQVNAEEQQSSKINN